MLPSFVDLFTLAMLPPKHTPVFHVFFCWQLNSYEGHQLPVSTLRLSSPHREGALPVDIITGSGDKTIILGSSEPRPPRVFLCLLLSLLLLLFSVPVLRLAFFA